MDLLDLLQHGWFEVAWDYCLENNLIIPTPLDCVSCNKSMLLRRSGSGYARAVYSRSDGLYAIESITHGSVTAKPFREDSDSWFVWSSMSKANLLFVSESGT